MSIKRTLTAAAAMLALCFPAFAGPAGFANDAPKPAPGAFTLIGHHGGGGGGGRGGGGGHGGFSMGGRGGMGSMGMSGQRFSGFSGNRYSGLRAGGYHRGRGYWRGGRWYAFDGYGVAGGGSCYWNCLEAGYSPAYCSANAYDFCY